MVRMPSKEHLEELYNNNTNVNCCYKLGVTQVTFLRWLDNYDIKKKGSPEQKKGIDHKKVLKMWWFLDGIWSQVVDYNGQYFFRDEWRDLGFFYQMKWSVIPPEIKPNLKSKIYCSRCMQYLSPVEFAPSVRSKESGKCSRCESERVRFQNDKARFKHEESL